ncbi:MAG: carboxypeptidase-like regulatory domain-containing protein [Planctomycetota bacterium]
MRARSLLVTALVVVATASWLWVQRDPEVPRQWQDWVVEAGGWTEVAPGEFEITAETKLVRGGETITLDEGEVVTWRNGMPVPAVNDPPAVDALFGPAISTLKRRGGSADEVTAPNDAAAGNGDPIEELPTGCVVDARSGRKLDRALVHYVFSHSDDGYPPIPVEGARGAVLTDSKGYFQVPAVAPEDPNLYLHLEVHHKDFLPLVHVIEGGHDSAGNWPFTTLLVRRAQTSLLQFVAADGGPVPDLAIEIEPPAEDRFLGEDTWEEGRSWRAGRPVIRYTDADGTLRIARDEQVYRVIDPVYSLWDRNYQEPALFYQVSPHRERSLGRAWEEWGIVSVRASLPVESTLVDARGAPIADTLVEVRLAPIHGGPPTQWARFYTGAQGEYLLAPRPYPVRTIAQPHIEAPCTQQATTSRDLRCTEQPRLAELTVLSPYYWKKRVQYFATTDGHDVAVNALPAAQLSWKIAVPGEDENGEKVAVGVPADGLRVVGPEWTIVQRGADGVIVLAGRIPEGLAVIDFSVAGFVPAQVVLPAHVSTVAKLDAGVVHMDRGESVTVRVATTDPELLERAAIKVAPVYESQNTQTYPLGSDGSVTISGFTQGDRYWFAIDGSRLEPQRAPWRVDAGTVLRGLDLEAVPRNIQEVRLTGVALHVPEEDAALYRVVERYHFDGQWEPLTCVSYPLPPDRRLGSVRWLPLADTAEVFVVGPALRVWHHEVHHIPNTPAFDLGRIEPSSSKYVVLRFCGFPAAAVLPTLELFSGVRRDHEVARVFHIPVNAFEDYLLLDNLQVGTHRLSWIEAKARRNYVFDVLEEEVAETLVVPCRNPEQAEQVVRVVNHLGKGLDGVDFEGLEAVPLAVATQIDLPWGIATDTFPDLIDEPGHYLARFETDRDLEVEVRHVQSPGVRIVVPQGRDLPAAIRLDPAVRLTGRVKDANGLPFDGVVDVSWLRFDGDDGEDPLEISGGVAGVPVRRGVLEETLVPAGRHRFTFADQQSAAEDERWLDIDAVDKHSVQLRLRETRSLRGTVWLPDGSPAIGATVALVHRDKAERWPQRDPIGLAGMQFSTRSDAAGRYEISGLPVELAADQALVAHLDGFVDAVQYDIDLLRLEHPLPLSRDDRLELDIGYGDEVDHPPYRFQLEHSFVGGSGQDLGPLLTTPLGGVGYRGITPGTYLVRWSHPLFPRSDYGYQQPFKVVDIFPGDVVELVFRINERFVGGTARLNQGRVAAGWVVATSDPSDPSALRMARVLRGTFNAPLPLTPGTHFAIFRDGENPPDPYRGEALLRPVPEDARLESGRVALNYIGYDLALQFPADALSVHETISIEFPHYEWAGSGYRERQVTEQVVSNPFRLRLLPAGEFVFTVWTGASHKITYTVDPAQDPVFPVGL